MAEKAGNADDNIHPMKISLDGSSHDACYWGVISLPMPLRPPLYNVGRTLLNSN